jgi:hypothetical protein
MGVVFYLFYSELDAPTPPLNLNCVSLFLFANGLRNVAYNTLTSKVPAPAIRARFQSLQSAVQHAAAGLAAGLSSLLLNTVDHPATIVGAALSGHRLVGMHQVAGLSMLLSALIPGMLFIVERGVRSAAATVTPLRQPAQSG